MNRTTDLARRGTCRSQANDTTFVEPGPPPARITVLPPAEMMPMLPTAATTVELRTTYEDRARGFQVATLPISVAFGVGALIVAIVGWAVPVVSVAALAVFWLAFLAWWLGGWLIHTLVSPDGIALIQAMMGYRYVRHEQKARLRRYHGKDER